MWTHLIWDFNGTLYDDVAAGVESINEMLRARGLCEFASFDDYRDIFDFPIEDYYRALGLDVDREGYDALAHEWVALYLAHSRTAGLRAGVAAVLDALTARNMPQLVLSASEREMLMGQLRGLGIADRFTDVLGLDNIYAGSKAAIAAAWRQAHPDARPLFVGDTLHDAEVAALIGADCVLITGGHHSRARLETAGVPVIDRFEELLSLVGTAELEEKQ
ncbi:MAG: HAD family hydrolase [Clostridia bacterium]|nr:HAD family hydrolase [Clostridia bacterium]